MRIGYPKGYPEISVDISVDIHVDIHDIQNVSDFIQKSERISIWPLAADDRCFGCTL